MASYQELFDLKRDSALRNKIAVACVKKAQTLMDGATPTANQITWSSNALENPIQMADKIMHYVIAANSTANANQISNATDAAIQSNVNAAADALIAGGITN